jgi:hypothetical protein
MFPWESIHLEFVHQFYKCTAMFHDIQTTVMDKNMRYFETGIPRDEDVMIQKLKLMVANHFMEVHDIRRLSAPEKLLCTGLELHKDTECWD